VSSRHSIYKRKVMRKMGVAERQSKGYFMVPFEINRVAKLIRSQNSQRATMGAQDESWKWLPRAPNGSPITDYCSP
jgi:hypothetical protein